MDMYHLCYTMAVYRTLAYSITVVSTCNFDSLKDVEKHFPPCYFWFITPPYTKWSLNIHKDKTRIKLGEHFAHSSVCLPDKYIWSHVQDLSQMCNFDHLKLKIWQITSHALVYIWTEYKYIITSIWIIYLISPQLQIRVMIPVHVM